MRAYFKQRAAKSTHEILERAFGAWRRTETVEENCDRARSTFSKSFHRHEVTETLAAAVALRGG